MANENGTALDEAKTGGGIGDIGCQPVDPSSENRGGADPVIEADPTVDRPGIVERDSEPSGEDPDAQADETLGQVV